MYPKGIIKGIHLKPIFPPRRNQTETFSALLALCEENPLVTGEFPSQRPVTRGFGVFLYLHLKKRLSKQSRRRRFEMPSRSLWCHCNASVVLRQPLMHSLSFYQQHCDSHFRTLVNDMDKEICRCKYATHSCVIKILTFSEYRIYTTV